MISGVSFFLSVRHSVSLRQLGMSTLETSVLTFVDHDMARDEDPSLATGERIIFDKEVCLNLRPPLSDMVDSPRGAACRSCCHTGRFL